MNELRAFGLGFPGAHTKSPWPGHLDLAVKGKTFAFMSTDGEPFSLTCKLPDSGVAALMFPFASAAAYGLGKSGWVNAQFEPGVTPPADIVQLFKDWIKESYRATAPKKLAAALAAERTASPVGDVLQRAAKRKPAKSAVKKSPVKKKKASAAAVAKKKTPAAPKKASRGR
jgi:predicted DNA-binding protein (MmcQ/YjbR family)